MTKFLLNKIVFLIECKCIYNLLDKTVEYKNVFLQHFSNHKGVLLKSILTIFDDHVMLLKILSIF